MRNKDIRFARYSTTVIGLKLIRGTLSTSSTGTLRARARLVANANRRRARNGNTRRDAVAKAA